MKFTPLILAFCLAALTPAAEADPGRKINHSPLDEVTIFRDSFDKTRPVRMQRFDADKADVGKSGKRKYADAARRMKETAPEALANGVVDKLKTAGFTDLAEWKDGEELPEDAIVISGELTVLIPGSQAARYWVGFGAGRSKVCGRGEVRTAAGQRLAEFQHCRVGFTGLTGGEASKQMSNDSYETGSHLAAFLAHWADGDYAD